MQFQEYTGIILAGGQSRRMGQNKALMQIGTKRLIDYVLDALSFLSPRILLSYNGTLTNVGSVKIIPDVLPGNGPASGLHAALANCETPRCLVISTDMPLLSSGFLKDFLANASSKPITAAMSPDGFIEPLCAIYDSNLHALLHQQIEQKKNKLMHFLITAGYEALDASKISRHWNPNLFTNINTPQDVLKLEDLLK